MTVDQKEADLEDQELEFQRIYAVMESHHEFGRDNQEQALYIRYKNREGTDAARRAFGPRCLNCADGNHFARECPSPYLNRSGVIKPEIGEGTADEVAALWRRWQQRLCQWHENRREARARRNN